MGDLLSKEMIADLIINIINILVLFFVTKSLLYKPIKKVLTERKNSIQSQYDEAKKKQAEADALKIRYEAVIADAKGQADAAVANAQAQANQAASKILKAARSEAQRIADDNRIAMEKEHNAMMNGAKDEIVNAVLELSGKILHREVSDADNRNIIDGFFGEE